MNWYQTQFHPSAELANQFYSSYLLLAPYVLSFWNFVKAMNIDAPHVMVHTKITLTWVICICLWGPCGSTYVAKRISMDHDWFNKIGLFQSLTFSCGITWFTGTWGHIFFDYWQLNCWQSLPTTWQCIPSNMGHVHLPAAAVNCYADWSTLTFNFYLFILRELA